ncbi:MULTISPECIES: XdhC family protein [Luteimonas]|uniref:XdhC family protein n=1 Tax=Luteimonas TaxID=83614 RepID=UPI000C7E4698|nr:MULTISPECIES: XdhC/CoxI family protein [Luteimonas]
MSDAACSSDVAAAVDDASGSAPHAVIGAACAAARAGRPATLALVLETDGSTYVAAGAAALFGPGTRQVGWLSGGCLEPEIARRAEVAAATGRLGWMEVDTRDDEDMLSGSALGCRGRLRLALLPLAALAGIDAPLQAWQDGRTPLQWRIDARGTVALTAGAARGDWTLPADAPDWRASAPWTLTFDAPPELLVCGAGPESPTLLPLLRTLGWKTTLAERRPRWAGEARHADRHAADGVAAALRAAPGFDAALVMHHNFELDRDALELLATHEVPFVGLLGPNRRREDLFQVLPAETIHALRPRLRSPIGLKLGGRGAEAIALSIAAQLQAWRHGEAA